MVERRYSFWSTFFHFYGYVFVLVGVIGLVLFLFSGESSIGWSSMFRLVPVWRMVLGLVLLGIGWLFRRMGLFPRYVLAWVVALVFGIPVLLEGLAVVFAILISRS